MKAYLELIRPWNGVMASLAVAIGFVVAGGTLNAQVIMAAVSAFLIISAGNTANDYFDLMIDKRNKPHRPIPSGRVKPAHALAFSMLLFFVGIALAAQINEACTGIAIVASFLLVFYATFLSKVGFVGNVIVAFETGLLFLFGEAITGTLFSPVISSLFLLALFSTLAREFYKDIEDMKADKGFRRTLPMKIGVKATNVLAALVLITAIGLSYLPFTQGLTVYYLAVVVLADLYLLFIVKKGFEKKFSFCAKHVKYAQALVLVAFLVGLV